MPNLIQRVGAAIRNKTPTNYDAQWLFNFMQLAANEDSGGSGTVTSPYDAVAWAHIAISRRAKNIARACFKLYTDSEDTEVESGPVWDLFNTGYLSSFQLWEATEGWRCIRGDAYWIFDYPGGLVGFPQKITIPDPAFMKAITDKSGKLLGYQFHADNGEQIPFKPEEVIHFPAWSPSSVDAMKSIQLEMDQERAVSRGNRALLLTNSVPGGIISIPGDFSSSDEAQKMIDKWERKHKGLDRAGAVAVLSSGAKYERVSLTPQEMQALDTRQWNRDTILAFWGVPHAVVGLSKEGSTLSGKDTVEQMKIFWQQTLIPELKFFEAKLKTDLFQRFKLKMEGEFELDEIPELQDDQAIIKQTVRADVAAGLLTINQAREMYPQLWGSEPVPWGDSWWAPISLTPISDSGSAPDAPPTTPPKPVNELFDVPALKGRPVLYSTSYRQMHWKAVIDPWEKIETAYAKKLKTWLFEIRQQSLHRIMTVGNWAAVSHSVMDELTGEPMWHDRVAQIKDISKPFFVQAMEQTGLTLGQLFDDLHVRPNFNIYDTGALGRLDYRVNRGSLKEVVDTVRDQMRSTLADSIRAGWSEQETAAALRERFNIAQNRTQMIARTEIGGVINDSRVEGFKSVGFREHEWLTARDDRVRESHQIDGEVAQIGQPFSNGLLYPNDPAGSPENVIQCRCLSMPVFGDGGPVEQHTVAPETKMIESVTSLMADMQTQLETQIAKLAERIGSVEKKPDKEPIQVTVNNSPPQTTVNITERKPGKTTFELDDFGNVIAAIPEDKNG